MSNSYSNPMNPHEHGNPRPSGAGRDRPRSPRNVQHEGPGLTWPGCAGDSAGRGCGGWRGRGWVAWLVVVLLQLGVPTRVGAQTTAFTYQGHLVEGGSPAVGAHDIEFRLLDGAGQAVGPVVVREGIEIAGGDFALVLDFGPGVFDGGERWLEIGVRRRGAANFTVLSPRQPVLAVPYALFATSSSGLAPGAAVRSLNGLRDEVQLVAGANMSITPNGNTLTFAATGGGGGDGFWTLAGAGLSYGGGNVGVGTASPAALLEVSGANGNALIHATAPRPNLVFRDTAAGGGRSTLGGLDGGLLFTTDSFQSGARATAFMTFDNVGRLGIGTTSPASAIHVVGVEDALRLAGPRPQLTFEDASTGLSSRIQGEAGGLVLRTQGAVAGSNPEGFLALTGTGRVGIGAPAPASRLEVAGGFDGHFSANLTLSGPQPTQLWSQDTGFATGQSPGSRHWAAHLAPNGSFGLYHRRVSVDFPVSTDSGWEPRLSLDPASGDLTLSGRLSRLDTAPAFAAAVRSADFLFGHPSRRGEPGRALVDWSDGAGTRALAINWADDWPETWIGGAITQVKALRITGGADLSEPFAMSSPGVRPGAVVVIDERNPGKLRLSTSAYDRKVAGVVSGANGIQPGISMIQEDALEAGENVALSGRVHVKANRTAGDIEPGDLLTTSGVPGEAMKAADHPRAQGAILGKAMTRLDEATGTVLVLVTLQ